MNMEPPMMTRRSREHQKVDNDMRMPSDSSSSSSACGPGCESAAGVCGDSSKTGPPGDHRMNKALSAKLNDPTMTLLEALQEGGFVFDYQSDSPRYLCDSKVFDKDNISLRQRKNQLNRRLRTALKRQEKLQRAAQQQATAATQTTVKKTPNHPRKRRADGPTVDATAALPITSDEAAAPLPEDAAARLSEEEEGRAIVAPVNGKSASDAMDKDMRDLLIAISEASDDGEDNGDDDDAHLISPLFTSEDEDDDDNNDLRELLDSIEEEKDGALVCGGISPVTSLTTRDAALSRPVLDNSEGKAVTTASIGYTHNDMQDLLASIRKEEDASSQAPTPPPRSPAAAAVTTSSDHDSTGTDESDEMNSRNIPQPDPLPVRNKRRLVIPGTDFDLIQTKELLPPYRWLPVIPDRTNCIVDFVGPFYLLYLGKKCGFDEYGIRNCWILLVVHSLYSTVTYWGPGTEKLCIRPWIPGWVHNIMDVILSFSLLYVPMLVTNHFGPHAVKIFAFMVPQIALHSFLCFNASLLRREEKKLGVKQA